MLIKTESCAATLGLVEQASIASDCLGPRLASDGKTSFLLQCQLKGYQNLGPSKTSLKLD